MCMPSGVYDFNQQGPFPYAYIIHYTNVISTHIYVNRCDDDDDGDGLGDDDVSFHQARPVTICISRTPYIYMYMFKSIHDNMYRKRCYRLYYVL